MTGRIYYLPMLANLENSWCRGYRNVLKHGYPLANHNPAKILFFLLYLKI